MKQTITLEQLNELSKKEKDILVEWCFKMYPDGFVSEWTEEDCTNPLLNIGQMIELLGENWWEHVKRLNPEFLCGELWQAVKEILKTNCEKEMDLIE